MVLRKETLPLPLYVILDGSYVRPSPHPHVDTLRNVRSADPLCLRDVPLPLSVTHTVTLRRNVNLNSLSVYPKVLKNDTE